MKKTIISALCILLLSGCGGSANQGAVIKESRTCKTFAASMDVEVTFEAENNHIKRVKARYTIPAEGLGINISDIDKELRHDYAQLVGDSIVDSFGQTRDELSFDFDGGLFVINLDAPYDKLTDVTKSQFYLTSDNFYEAIETLKVYDAICE